MYEVEYKVEINEKEREDLLRLCKHRNFVFKGVTPQFDIYIEASKSPFRGHDLKRYRKEGDRFIYTEKIWELAAGERARRENEWEVTEEEFRKETAKYPNAVSLKKERERILGDHNGLVVTISIDSVKFIHSPSVRYFVEGEVITTNKLQVHELRHKIQEFLKELLGKREIVEAPGLLSTAVKER